LRRQLCRLDGSGAEKNGHKDEPHPPLHNHKAPC
jgi:hypothetical protein